MASLSRTSLDFCRYPSSTRQTRAAIGARRRRRCRRKNLKFYGKGDQLIDPWKADVTSDNDKFGKVEQHILR